MVDFKVSNRTQNNVWAIYRSRDAIESDPLYQRQSDIWTLEKRQLLIDTLFNKFDVPKIYLHKYPRIKNKHEYSIIDGKQRLEAIWDFIDNKYPLSDDFQYFHDKTVNAAGKTYKAISKEYPDIKSDFDAFPLTVVEIETDDMEMIEEMFSRLNEAVPLNAAEKRNAYPGPLPKAIRDISNEPFFTEKVAFSNNRYRHYDLATKFLYVEDNKKILDTKKVYLDKFVDGYSKQNRSKALPFAKETKSILQLMTKVFKKHDALLKSTGMIMLYYYLFNQALQEGWVNKITHTKLSQFEEKRVLNREKAKKNLETADYDLLEFDKFTQSPNDKYAMELRLKILLAHVYKKKPMKNYCS